MGFSIFSSTPNLENQVNELKQKIDINQDNLVTKDELIQYFSQLTDKIDSNNDGVITQDELENYVKTQMVDKDKEVEKWKKLYEEASLKTQILEEENHRLKAYLDFATGEETIERKSYVSTKCISDYIEDNILSSEANSKYIPDSLERKTYISFYKSGLENLKQFCDTSSFGMANHKISMILEPNY